MRKWLWILLMITIAIMLPYSIKAQDRPNPGAAQMHTDVQARGVVDHGPGGSAPS